MIIGLQYKNVIAIFQRNFNPIYQETTYHNDRCSGICKQFKTKPTSSCRYKSTTYCHDCEVRLPKDWIYCVCCGTKLRTKPRGRRSKDMCGYRDERRYIE